MKAGRRFTLSDASSSFPLLRNIGYANGIESFHLSLPIKPSNETN